MLLIVDTTELLICVMTNTPQKVEHCAHPDCRPGLPIHLVVIQVAIAFGASVHPFTKITPKVSSTVMASTGLAVISPQKDKNDISIDNSFRFQPYISFSNSSILLIFSDYYDNIVLFKPVIRRHFNRRDIFIFDRDDIQTIFLADFYFPRCFVQPDCPLF